MDGSRTAVEVFEEGVELAKSLGDTRMAERFQAESERAQTYVRFYRMAERRIVEKTHPGIVCFISNYSWLDGLSFTGMRERYLEAFDRIWIDCLNGDKYKTGKLTPDGEPDPSIFSTEFNREGIQVGTAIALLLRREKSSGTQEVEFRDLWGKSKHEQLLSDAAEKDRRSTKCSILRSAWGCPFKKAAARQITSGGRCCPSFFQFRSRVSKRVETTS